MEQKKTYSVRFASIDTISKNMAKSPEGGIGKAFSFHLKVETVVLEEKHLLFIVVHAGITEENKAGTLAEFTTSCTFELEDFHEHIAKREDGLYKVPPDLDSVLRHAAISTSRGIIHMELKGSYLHDAIVPLVQLQNFTTQSA